LSEGEISDLSDTNDDDNMDTLDLWPTVLCPRIVRICFYLATCLLHNLRLFVFW
jgi:hypothetical protein